MIEINQDDSGEVVIASKDRVALEKVRAIIEGLTQELKIGTIYPAKVVSLKDFGAFCEIAGTGQDGLVHVTEISEARGIRVEDYLQVGMEVEIKMVSADTQGRNRFSIKAARQERGQPQLGTLSGLPSTPGPAGGMGERRFQQSRPMGSGGPPRFGQGGPPPRNP